MIANQKRLKSIQTQLLNIVIYIQQDATLSGNCTTCFGWYHHPSSGAQTTASTAPGICYTVTATTRTTTTVTAIELSLGGSSSYTSTDKTNKNKYT
jgi:hypothetical protein